jgi:hypothetical protein
MKNFILSVVLSFVSFVGFSQEDTSVLNSYMDSMNSVRVVSMKPNSGYLEFVNQIYFPSVSEYNFNYSSMEILEFTLESRYGCKIGFIEESETDGIRDMVFEVFQDKEVIYSVLILNLSVIEQLHQEGQLINQLNEYCKWSDLFINQ